MVQRLLGLVPSSCNLSTDSKLGLVRYHRELRMKSGYDGSEVGRVEREEGTERPQSFPKSGKCCTSSLTPLL